jgi:hypothetical protein
LDLIRIKCSKVNVPIVFDWEMKSSINQHSWRLWNGNRSGQWKTERFIASPGGQQIGPAAALLFAVRHVIEWLLCFYLLASCLQIRSIHRLDHGQGKLRPWRRLCSVAARSNLPHEATKSQLYNFKKKKLQFFKFNSLEMRLSGSRWIVYHNNPMKNDLLVMLVDSVPNTLQVDP